VRHVDLQVEIAYSLSRRALAERVLLELPETLHRGSRPDGEAHYYGTLPHFETHTETMSSARALLKLNESHANGRYLECSDPLRYDSQASTHSCGILKSMPPYPFGEWIAENLRLTTFTLPGADNLPVERWWENCFGGPPEESTQNLRLGTKSLTGDFGGGKLTLKLEPGRIDWLVFPQVPNIPDDSPGEVPSIGPIADTFELFSGLAERWLRLDGLPEIIRIAFGTVVRHPEQDSETAYARLPDYLHFQIPSGASDFNFQINIPTASRTGIQGLRVNRLSRWSILAFARIAFRVEGPRISQGSAQLMDHSLHLEIDVNTSPGFRGAITHDRIIDVFRELVELARGIVTDGIPQ
jgi:hypothetical protein